MDYIAMLSAEPITRQFSRVADQAEYDHCHDCENNLGCQDKVRKRIAVINGLWAWHALQN